MITLLGLEHMVDATQDPRLGSGGVKFLHIERRNKFLNQVSESDCACCVSCCMFKCNTCILNGNGRSLLCFFGRNFIDVDFSLCIL